MVTANTEAMKMRMTIVSSIGSALSTPTPSILRAERLFGRFF
jgi:hypothetical protein